MELILYREKFSKAIEIEPSNHVLYSNRSGAYASLKDWEHSLEDALKTTEIKPDWSKGWSRKGGALHGGGDLGELRRHGADSMKLTLAQSVLLMHTKRLSS